MNNFPKKTIGFHKLLKKSFYIHYLEFYGYSVKMFRCVYFCCYVKRFQ